MSHTILLLQQTASPNTRTYLHYPSVNKALEGLCGVYETFLKNKNPRAREITYTPGDLENYLEGLTDLSALTFKADAGLYQPHDKAWVKARVKRFLEKLAGRQQ